MPNNFYLRAGRKATIFFLQVEIEGVGGSARTGFGATSPGCGCRLEDQTAGRGRRR